MSEFDAQNPIKMKKNNRTQYEIETNDLRNELLKHFKLQKNNNKKAVFKTKTEELLKCDSKRLMQRNDYKDLIYNDFSYKGITEFEPELEVVPIKDGNRQDYKALNDIWNYLKTNQSSANGSTMTACRRIRILVRDKKTKKYVGLVSVDSANIENSLREQHIGWSRETKDKNLQKIVNIRTCVGLQGFAFNTHLGKLLIMLTFSKEVQDIYYNKYKDTKHDKYVAVLTTSIEGKSCQYGDIKDFNYIGLTKGINVGDIPESLYKKSKDYFEKYVKKPKSHLRKLYLMSKLCNYLGIGDEFDEQKMPRGVYIKYLSDKSKDYLKDKISNIKLDLPSIDEITKEWKQRYAIKRYMKLSEENKLKKYISIDDQFKKLNKHKYMKDYVIKMKNLLGTEKVNEINRTKVEMYRIKQKVLPINPIFSHYRMNPSYLAGFIDGDGSIYICDNLSLQVTITQCNLDILLIVNNYFNNFGNIYSYDKTNNTINDEHELEKDDCQLPTPDIEKINEKFKGRRIYNLRFTGLCCKPILEYVKSHLVIKHQQAKLALEYTSYIRKEKTNKKLETKNKVKSLNHDGVLSYKLDRVNSEYISGLFDAEGCVRNDKAKTATSNNGTIKISQMNHPVVLYKIQEFFDAGVIKQDPNKYDELVDSFFIIKYNLIRPFMLNYLKHMIVKRIQVEALDEIFKTCSIGRALTQKIIDARKHNLKIIEDSKHISIEIPNDILTEYNAYNRYETQDIKKCLSFKMKTPECGVKCICGKIYSKNSINRHKKLHCDVLNGITKIDHEEVGSKISNTKLLKGSNVTVPDITIELIRKDLSSTNKTVTQLSFDYKVCSDVIYAIKKGTLVPTYERNQDFINNYRRIQILNKELKVERIKIVGNDKGKLQSYTNTMNVRKFDFDTALKIISYKHSQYTTDNVVDMKFKRTDGECITKEQIKNLWSGRTKLYDHEFSDDSEMTYNEYIKAIKTKANNNKHGSNKIISDENLKLAYKIVESDPSINATKLETYFEIDSSTATKIMKKQLTYKDMDIEEYNNIKKKLNDDKLKREQMFLEMDKKYSGIDYINWKRSYYKRIKKGLTIPIIVEILNQKGETKYDELAEIINKKHDLTLSKSLIQNICSKTSIKLYPYDFDVLIYPEQEMTFEDAIAIKNYSIAHTTHNSNKKYSNADEKEIIETFMNNMDITIVSIVSKYRINKGAVGKMKLRAKKLLEEL